MSARQRLDAARLYGILDLGYTPVDAAVATAEALLEGGVDLLQLRAKNLDEARITALAVQVKPVCARHKIPFIINDFPGVANEAGADGVHLGQECG